MDIPLRFAVLGDPIDHSLSPAIHTAAMRHLGLEGTYEARRGGTAELASSLDELREGRLYGINITMPLKREAARVAEFLTPEATASNSVNTLRSGQGVIQGHSTDVVAARSALADPRFDAAAPVLVLGSGGAAAAILAGIDSRLVYLSARNPGRASLLIDRIDPPAVLVPFGTAVAGAVVINATPLGMDGESLPDEITGVAAGIIDLAYGPEETRAIGRARSHEVPHMDGVEFLVLQAAASFEWWTGLDAPIDVMLEAARKP